MFVWFSQLCSRGPSFGYFLKLSKSFFIVNALHKTAVKEMFGALEVQVVMGHHVRCILGRLFQPGAVCVKLESPTCYILQKLLTRNLRLICCLSVKPNGLFFIMLLGTVVIYFVILNQPYLLISCL